MLCTWHMDTAVKAYTAKTFGWQKNEDTNRFVPSELANEFLSLYRKCRYTETELLFNEAYAALDERAKCGEIQQADDEYDPTWRDPDMDNKIDEELDIIARPIDNPTAPTSVVKDTPERWQKIVRYLQTT